MRRSAVVRAPVNGANKLENMKQQPHDRKSASLLALRLLSTLSVLAHSPIALVRSPHSLPFMLVVQPKQHRHLQNQTHYRQLVAVQGSQVRAHGGRVEPSLLNHGPSRRCPPSPSPLPLLSSKTELCACVLRPSERAHSTSSTPTRTQAPFFFAFSLERINKKIR